MQINLIFAAQFFPLGSFVDVKFIIICTIGDKTWNIWYFLKTFFVRYRQSLE